MMSKPIQAKSNKPKFIFLEDFPTLPKTTEPAPKKQTPPPQNSSQTQPKPTVEDFPALVTERPTVVQAQQKEQKQPLQTKKQKPSNDFPSIVSKPAPIFDIGTKEAWQPKKPSTNTNLNRSHQVPRTQPLVISKVNTPSVQRPKTPVIQTPNKPVNPKAQETQRKSSSSRFSEKYIHNSSESQSQSEQNDTWPNFQQLNQKIKKIQQFKIPLCFPTVKHYLYQKAPDQDYSTHYEKGRVHQYFHQTSESHKWAKWVRLGKLRVLCINCDFNIPSRCGNNESSGTDDSDGSDYKRIVKEYWKTTEQQRAKQIVHQVKLAILEGVDFICLQEICQPIIRDELLKMIDSLKYSGSSQYFFPRNLESHEFIRTTMILSKYPVKFGHLKFEIIEHENQDETKFYFPLQAFCEFEIMMGRKVQKVGIMSCHLRSNGEKGSGIRPHKMRQMQVRCIHDFSKRFDKFFCIGDTNIPSSEKFKNENIWIKRKFVDAFDVGKSAIGGTYMFRTRANIVKEQRMDRVWMKKQMRNNTDVQIAFKEVLLESCKNKGFNKKEMMTLDDEKLIYISPSDHEILDIGIQFTRYD